MATPLFQIRDLEKIYRMGDVEVHALRTVNLTLDTGQFIVLLGPSGSGKSTLLNIIGGLDVPTSGQVFYRDTELTRADEAALTAYRRRHVGFVFQFYNLIPSLTASENVGLVTEIAEDPMAPEAALRLVQLDHRASHFPAQLSGGEQQRLAIARAIAKRPAVLLCDEPTGALDIATGIVVLEALVQVSAELGTTTVVITHNAVIAQMADRVIRLADGRVTAVEERAIKTPPRELSVGNAGLSALNRKLFRDLLAMKGQAFAIAMVVAAGVAMYVMYLSNFASLQGTRAAYYERQRFADVFASLKRAPERVGSEIAALPDVSVVETRVVANVTLDLEQVDEPASGRLISISPERRPGVNDLFVRRGRWIEPGRPDEVLASEGFVIAHGLNPGDTVRAVINGRLRRLTIVGVALSPEFVYSIRPGELVPDDRRFGVFWMDRGALGAAFDMEGGFNDVVLRLAPGIAPAETIARVDAILEPYGGLGAIPRRLQLSNWTVDNELAQLQSFGFMLPLVFLLVAAFILNIALTRALALQRPQLAALKALGYTNVAIGWHYLKWALVIGLLGVVIGMAAGAWLGYTIINLYNEFFRFPVLLFRVPLRVVVGATALTLGAAAAGAMSAVLRAVRVPPAEAMRPEAPALYRRSILEVGVLSRHLGGAGRMVLRNVTRHPLRTAASIFGIAFAVAILMIGLVFSDAIEHLIQTQFWVAERQDVTVSFVEPRSDAARLELAHLPGVIAVEPQRMVGVRIRSGHRERYLSITGVPPGPRFRRIVDRDGRTIQLASSGVVLSRTLATVLDVTPGDSVTLEVLEGARPVRQVTVVGEVDDILGLSIYMDLGALHRLLREGGVASGALLLVDPEREADVSKALKALPAVAGAGFKRAVVESFRETMAANLGLTIAINLVFAGVIGFGVVYNAARVSLSERSRELASLRVLGFTRAEISMILLGELALLTLAALPVGALLGYGLASLIARTIQSEVYRVPLYISRQAIAWSFLGIMGASAISGLLVRRQLDALDLIAVLKVRE